MVSSKFSLCLAVAIVLITICLFQIKSEVSNLNNHFAKSPKVCWQYTTFMAASDHSKSLFVLYLPDHRSYAPSIGRLLLNIGYIDSSDFVKVGERNFVQHDLFNILGTEGWQLVQCDQSRGTICTFKRQKSDPN